MGLGYVTASDRRIGALKAALPLSNSTKCYGYSQSAIVTMNLLDYVPFSFIPNPVRVSYE
jgi:hypothetical protein